jgi:long-chain acyl-CoA synthetase
MGDLLDQAVKAYGARPCIYFMGKRLSFTEIGALSDRAAKGLRALGVGEGVKVGLLLPNSPAFVIFYYGVLKAGGTIVNFNPLYSLEEIEFQIRDSGAKIMVTLDLALTFGKIEALLKSGALDKAVVASFTAQLPALKSVGFKLTQRMHLANASASPAKGKIVLERNLLANDGNYERPAITPDAIAVLQYTGGTTGTPKGAMLTHANLSTNVAQVKLWQNRPAPEGDRMLGILPLFHVFAMTTVLNFGIVSGMEIILLPKFEVIETLKLIGKLRPTMMPGVPTLFNAILRHPHIANFDLSSLEYCISGGAALPLEVKRGFEALCRVSVVEGMGPYLRPEMLHTVLSTVLQAHRFFEHPAGRAALLRRLGVNEVIVVKGVRIGSMVGVLEDGVDPTVFRSVSYLQLVHSSPLFDVYRVRGSGGGQFPDPTTIAGFRCERGVVAGG